MKKHLFRNLVFIVLTICASAAWASPQTVDTEFTDAARDRKLPMRLRIPLRMPDGDGKLPLVIFSHGLGGSRDGGKLWGEHWAANGYFVIHTQHPGSDIELLKTGAGAPLQKLKRGANGEQLIARAEDVRFVIDEVARRQASGDTRYARIDLNRIAMTGHSFGAMTTMALAGQRYPRTDKTLTDARIKAFLSFSPQVVQTSGSANTNFYSDIKKPFFVVTGTIDGDMLGNGASPDRRAAAFDVLPPIDKFRVVFENGDHMVFGGGAMRESDTFLQFIGNKSAHTDAATAAVIQDKTKTLTLKFLEAYLKDDASAKAWLANEAAKALGSAGVWAQK
jgi:dienelactone hydrolase